MSESQEQAFELAVASVSIETDKLTDELVELLRESIANNRSIAEVLKRLFANFNQRDTQ